MTEGAVLSAAFVVISVIAIGLGFGYAGYLDIGVPVLIVIIYLRCGVKYTILSGITSLLIIGFTLGNISAAIFMSQSMVLGLICGIVISRDANIIDDLLISSIIGCIVMIFVDINFSNLTGISLIKQSKEYLANYPYIAEGLKKELFYFLMGTLPIGNIFITYFFSIILGKKIKILNEFGYRKFLIVTKFRRYGSYISCSRTTVNIGVLSLISIFLLMKIPMLAGNTYIDIIFNSSKYIILFFLIQDSFTLIIRYIFSLTKSRWVRLIMQIILIEMLINYFVFTSIVIIIFNLALDNILNIKGKQEYILNELLEEKRELEAV